LTIWHVDGERGFRGGERQLLYLACALRARGHRNVVVCRGGSELEAASKERGLETRSLPFLCEWDPLTAALLRSWTSGPGHILHAHTAHAAALTSLAARFGGAPSVAHRRVDFSTGSLSARFKYGSAAKVVAVSGAIAKVLEADGFKGAAVVPDAIPASVKECEWAGVSPSHFSPPSVDERRAARAALAAEFNIEDSGPWIGNLAALVPHKDHETLVAAALIVCMKNPRVRFLIAGRGPEEAKLWGQIKRLGLLGKVLLLGQHEDAAVFLKALDAFCLSSWGEGMGSVLLEAAACGVPIAATTAGGIPEVVEDGKTALLAPPRDPEALAAALLRLLEDKSLAHRLAVAGREALPRFGLERMAKEMERIYGEAVA
jgi:glycosyltransferase involved in cell wall biosynthesis